MAGDPVGNPELSVRGYLGVRRATFPLPSDQ